MTKPLDTEVRELLGARKGGWRQVADSSGISHSWISQFMRNKIPNPGYATLTKLRDHLEQSATQRQAA